MSGDFARGDVDFLEEILTRGGVGFIGRGETLERGAEVAGAARVEVGLLRVCWLRRHSYS